MNKRWRIHIEGDNVDRFVVYDSDTNVKIKYKTCDKIIVAFRNIWGNYYVEKDGKIIWLDHNKIEWIKK